MKFTPWFPPEIKPVHVGVYPIKMPYTLGEGFAYWSGVHWGNYQRSPELAQTYGDGNDLCTTQNKVWRGLAEKPD
jgi:hypothetical protein